jgi:hypothetical protein
LRSDLRPPTNFVRKELRLFRGREVAALGEPVVANEIRVDPLRPAPRCRVDVIREDAHGHRDGDVLRGEESELVLPIETRRRDSRIREPVESV